MQKVNDVTYPTGERWLEVSPAKDSSNLCLVLSPARTAPQESRRASSSPAATSSSTWPPSASGASAVDERPLREGEVLWWSGAPLAGVSTQFRLQDPDGNCFLVVAAT